MNNHAQALFCTLQTLFTSPYQRASFRTMIALFLRADGRPHLRSAATKSAGAHSRFLSTYRWNARAIVRHTRRAAIDSLLRYYAARRGRRPRLLVMLDLTTLEKACRFERLDLVRVLNKKRGVHLVLMSLVAGPLRVPWGWRVWRGKGERPPGELALLRTLPTALAGRFRPLVLADAGLGSRAFLEGVHSLGLDAVVGMRRNRRVSDRRRIDRVASGEEMTLRGCSFPVTVARYRVRRRSGRETRYLVATFRAPNRLLSRWGRRRWRIEGFFKTAKGRFGLARFGQGTRTGCTASWCCPWWRSRWRSGACGTPRRARGRTGARPRLGCGWGCCRRWFERSCWRSSTGYARSWWPPECRQGRRCNMPEKQPPEAPESASGRSFKRPLAQTR